jgi:uncharacterized protein (TIGR03435 family)
MFRKSIDNESPRTAYITCMGTIIATLLLVSSAGFAQPAPSFDVATIKPGTGDGSFSQDTSPDGRFSARNLTVWNLIRFGYNLTDLQIIGGPGWIKTQGFDIQAQPATPVAKEETFKMVQSLLKDRFRLQAHKENRETPAFSLTVASSGPKLPPANGEGARTMQMGSLNTSSMTLASLCQILEFELGRPVVDRTGLQGAFAIQLQWASDKARVPDSTLPALTTAVQEQLGLKLDSVRNPVEVLVIDNIQQPSEN